MLPKGRKGISGYRLSYKETDIEKETTVNDAGVSLEDETKLFWLRRFFIRQEDNGIKATTKKLQKIIRSGVGLLSYWRYFRGRQHTYQ
jgi:hypothetical protein